MSNNVVPIDSQNCEEQTLLEKEQVTTRLVSIGVNQVYRSYDGEQKEIYNSFINSELSFIAPCWNHLNDQVKVDVITAHNEEFLKFISSGG